MAACAAAWSFSPRATIATLAPDSANRRATPKPIPLLPPVTMATRSFIVTFMVFSPVAPCAGVLLVGSVEFRVAARPWIENSSLRRRGRCVEWFFAILVIGIDGLLAFRRGQ